MALEEVYKSLTPEELEEWLKAPIEMKKQTLQEMLKVCKDYPTSETCEDDLKVVMKDVLDMIGKCPDVESYNGKKKVTLRHVKAK